MARNEWEWLDRFAEELGEDPLGRDEIGAMLRLSRAVAHGVERKFAPLSTFVAGRHVSRRIADGLDARTALGEIEDAARALIPEVPAITDPADHGRPRRRHGRRGRFGWFGRRRRL